MIRSSGNTSAISAAADPRVSRARPYADFIL
jgi:hypothetical protein